MKWLVLSILLVACAPTSSIGMNDPDAATQPDGQSDSGTGSGDDASLTCACDASSCGSRVCGRSDCGFPCGECAPDEYCFTSGAGTSCNAGTGPGAACIDAFGDRVWEGDRGFRACPSDPAQQQRCTCSGGGADAWMTCEATCVEICAQVPAGIACGAPGCDTGDVCCIPTASTDSRTCATGACPASNHTRACDGPEDCSNGDVCCGGDNPWSSTCASVAACGSLEQYCHVGSDCPASEPFCCPGPVEDMRSCSATDSPSCT